MALEAHRAPQLPTAWLDAGNPLGEMGSAIDIRREVAAPGIDSICS